MAKAVALTAADLESHEAPGAERHAPARGRAIG